MFLAVVGVLWIACALATRYVAKRRGLSSADWYFFTGLFFGIFALAFVVFVPVNWIEGTKKVNPPSQDGEWPPLTSRLDNWRSKHPR